MVESFAPSQTGSEGDNFFEEQIDCTEILLDHYIGPLKIQAMTYCDGISMLSLALSDGSL